MKKKNARRSDGRIAVQVYVGIVDGKRKYKTVYGATQKEADEKANLVRASMRKGLEIPSDRDTFGLWAERWLEIHSSEVSHGVMSAYRGAAIQLHPLYHRPISSIRPFDLQQIVTSLSKRHPTTGKPASKHTLKVIQITARQIFRLAIDNRVLEYNPADCIKIPSSAPSEKRRALTQEEQGWILHTPHRAQRAAMIMMLAGLRRGEVIALTWRDIDLKSHTIRIDKSVEMINGRANQKDGGKTTTSTRTVDIPKILVDYLNDELKKDLSAQDGKVTVYNMLVCPNAQGKMHNTTSWRRLWESYMKELNFRYGKFIVQPKSKMQPGGVPMVIPPITAHWLRHTFATMLYHAGVDVLTAKEQLGHSDVKTTLEIYTHLDSIHKRKSMEKLNEFLSASTEGLAEKIV